MFPSKPGLVMMPEGKRTDLLLLRRGGVASGAKAMARADEQPLIILIADTLNSIIFEIHPPRRDLLLMVEWRGRMAEARLGWRRGARRSGASRLDLSHAPIARFGALPSRPRATVGSSAETRLDGPGTVTCTQSIVVERGDDVLLW